MGSVWEASIADQSLDLEPDASPDASPDEVLDLLYRSVVGYPTSQKVERQTRCVTVRYADRMHLDITPAVRLPHGAELRATSSTLIPTIRRGGISMCR